MAAVEKANPEVFTHPCVAVGGQHHRGVGPQRSDSFHAPFADQLTRPIVGIDIAAGG